MKRIGILGGLSAESTTHVYSAITRLYVERFGQANYPEIVLFSVRFQMFMDWVEAGAWDRFAAGLVDGLRALEAAGADFAVIAANLPHVVFDQVRPEVSIPMLHIADVVSDRVRQHGYRRVGLIGTIATMQASFYPERLARGGIECIVPDAGEQRAVQDVLERELFRGIVRPASTQAYIDIIRSLKARGADAVILGCTEIPMLITPENSPLPTFDSTALLVERTLDEALAPG